MILPTELLVSKQTQSKFIFLFLPLDSGSDAGTFFRIGEALSFSSHLVVCYYVNAQDQFHCWLVHDLNRPISLIGWHSKLLCFENKYSGWIPAFRMQNSACILSFQTSLRWCLYCTFRGCPFLSQQDASQPFKNANLKVPYCGEWYFSCYVDYKAVECALKTLWKYQNTQINPHNPHNVNQLFGLKDIVTKTACSWLIMHWRIVLFLVIKTKQILSYGYQDLK